MRSAFPAGLRGHGDRILCRVRAPRRGLGTGSKRRRAGCLALAASMIALLVMPALASARPLPLKMIWGPLTLPNGHSAFPTYRKLGVKVYQIELLWNDAAPTRPRDPTNPRDRAYVWPSYLDQAVRAARHAHIAVCILVQRTPDWANGGRGSTWTPNNPADYGKFLIAAARHYSSVRYWMIWGEPNRNPEFEPMPSEAPAGPRAYALVLNAGYHAP